MLNKQQRIDAFEKSSQQIQNLYVSMELTYLLKKLSEQIQTEKQGDFIDCVGDTILGFYMISDMPRLFQQKLNLSADDSQRMTSKLIEILSPVVRREEEAAQNKKEELNKLAQTFAKPAAPAQPAPVEEYQGGVEPIRTMEQDMNRVHGYGAYREQQEQQEEKVVSSQDDLLKKD
jgi:hypothetical protein